MDVCRWIVAAVVAAAGTQAAANPCRDACRTEKQACVRTSTSAFASGMAACAAEPAGMERRACVRAARSARRQARAACRAARAACVAACGPTTTTLPGGVTCGDPEPAALRGVTAAHDAVRRDPSLDAGGVQQPAPQPPVPALCYSASVGATAQAWAERCRFMHNPDRGQLGENLYATTEPPSSSTGADAVTAWASEARYYDHASNTCSAPTLPGTCGHYTQVVWRGTTTVGCGISRCVVNSPFSGFPEWTLLVCDYRPPGNVAVCDASGTCVLQHPY